MQSGIANLALCADKLLHQTLGSRIASHVALHQVIHIILAGCSCQSLHYTLHCH